jgi:3-oxoacyl-(acyl-carrier-protein) synthase
MVSGKKALAQAGLDKEANASAFSALDLTRCGVLVGSGMGGLSVFQDGESGSLPGEGFGRLELAGLVGLAGGATPGWC